MTHGKHLPPRFLEDNDVTAGKSATQILSLNLACTFLLTNFLITSLYNFWVST